MTTFAQEVNESLNLIPESAPGVATINGDKVPLITPSFNPKATQYTDQSQSGQPQATAVVRGKQSVAGTSSLTANRSSLLALGLAAFGGHRVRGDVGHYTHEYWLSTQQTYTVEQKLADVNAYLQFVYSIISKSDFTLASEDIMKAAFDIVGARMLSPIPSSSLATGTLTDRTSKSTMLPFQYLRAAIKVAGSALATVQSLDISTDRKALVANAMDENPYAAVVYTQKPTCSGKMVAHFTDDFTTINAAMNPDNAQSIIATVPQGSFFGCQFELPNVKLQLPSIAASAGLKNQTIGYDADGTGSVAAQLRSKFFVTPTDLTGLTLIFTATGAGAQTITFAGTEVTPDLVATKINATATFVTASVERMKGETGGSVVLKMIAPGSANSLQIGAGTANTALGFTDLTLTTGIDDQTILLRVFTDIAL